MGNTENNFPHHFSTIVDLEVTPGEAFQFLDNPMNLSSHMSKSSWMMAGSKMEMKLDHKKGLGVGAEIILEGRILNIPLFVRQFVIESEAPRRKIWQTKGPQSLIVMDQYQMGFRLKPQGSKTELKVFINYSLPKKGAGLILGKLFANLYAKWCTDSMAKDAAKHFNRS